MKSSTLIATAAVASLVAFGLNTKAASHEEVAPMDKKVPKARESGEIRPEGSTLGVRPK
jgi:hypothetical protein